MTDVEQRWACLPCSDAAGVTNDPARHVTHPIGSQCPRSRSTKPSLIQQLRESSALWRSGTDSDLYRRAADALETAEAELGRVREEKANDPLIGLRSAKYLNGECLVNGCQWLNAGTHHQCESDESARNV